MTTVAEPETDLEALLDNEAPCTFRMVETVTGAVRLDCGKPVEWVGKLQCGHQLLFCAFHRVFVCRSWFPLRCSTCGTIYAATQIAADVEWHRV